MEDEHLIFEGIDGNECERFIQEIRRKARAANRSRDSAWITELVSTCMTGPALRWYIQLDPDVAEDWTQLQKVMFAKWPASDGDKVGRSSSMPTPAAAPGLATGPPSATALASPASDIIPSFSSLNITGPKRGYIRLNTQSSGPMYVSSTLSTSAGKAGFGTCASPSQALVVQFTQGCAHRPISMTLLNSPDGLQNLAVAQHGTGYHGPRSAQWGLLVSASNGRSATSTPGVVREAVWTVCPVDNSVRIIWSADGSEYLLSCLLSVTTQRPIFVSNVPSFRAAFPGARYTDADLVFEEM